MSIDVLIDIKKKKNDFKSVSSHWPDIFRVFDESLYRFMY